MPVSFRYSNYDYGRTPTHVYVVTKDERGRDIIVDGVWKYFNSEKEPNYKFDHRMNVNTLSGTGIGKAKKKRRGWLGKFFKKVWQLNKKIGLAIPRRAYRTLVALNFRGLGRKINRANTRSPQSVQAAWEKLGGKYSELMHSVNAGKKRKQLFGIEALHVAINGNGIGVEPATTGTAAIIAAATPILVAFAQAIGKGKMDQPLPGEAADPNETPFEKIVSAGTDIYRSLTKGKNPDDVLNNEPEIEKGQNDTPQFTGQIKPIYIVGGLGLAALLLLRKK